MTSAVQPSRGRRPSLFDWLFLLAALAIFIASFRPSVPSFPFAYDESDYMSAARKGMVENYIERSSMSLPNYVETGLDVVRGEFGTTTLSEFIRSQRDLTFYRHYHGPLYYHWLAAVSHMVHGDEYGMRISGWVFHLLTFVSVYLGIVLLFGPVYRPAAMVSSALYLWNTNNIITAAELSSHVIFIWLSFATLLVIARFAQQPSLRGYFGALTCCTVSLCALEYGVVLFVALALALVLVRKPFFNGWARAMYVRWILQTIGCVLGVLLILWPAGLLRGTVAEGFIYIVYLSKFRKGSFGNVTPLGVWRGHIAFAPLEYIAFFVLFASAAILIWRSTYRAVLLPVLIYPALLFLTTFKNTADAPRYISSLFAPVYFVAGVLICEKLARIGAQRLTAIALLIAGTFCLSAYRITVAPMKVRKHELPIQGVLAFIKAHPDKSYLVPAVMLPTTQYYFPNTTIRSYVSGATTAQVQQQRRNGAFDYVCIPQLENTNADVCLAF